LSRAAIGCPCMACPRESRLRSPLRDVARRILRLARPGTRPGWHYYSVYWRKYLESWVGSEWVGRSHLCVCRVGTPPRRVNNYSIGCHSDRIEEQTQGKHVTRSFLGRSVGRRPPRADAPPIMIVEQVLVRLPAAPAAARRPGSRGPARIDPGRRARSLAAPLPASLARRVGGRRHRVQLRGLVHREKLRSAFSARASLHSAAGWSFWVGASAWRS
jgi:hypothetical protein